VMATGAKYFVLTPWTSKREDVTTTFNPGQDLIGEPYVLGGNTLPIPGVSEDAKAFLRLGRIRDLREGKASGFKYVVSVR
ncbi:hypothetical protein OEZ84_27540, partial [Leclercia adecarboxylata]|uniref:hypothetical protein n=1 Tax=Leclercia adecarboxylata TaxID=83655 RepID=UPI00234DEA36